MGAVLVIMPCFDERENLPRVVPEVLATGPAVELLIIDDASPDGSGRIATELAAAEPRIQVLHRAGKLGLGTAYVTGFRWALARGYERVIQMDADLSHDPAMIPWFLRNLPPGGLVVGTRYRQGIRILNWPLSRLMLSVAASWYVRLITGMPLTDPTSGYKCFDASALAVLDLDRIGSNGYSFQIEVNHRLWMAGRPICELPIIFHDRVGGVSKMSSAIVREALWRVWSLRLAARGGGRPRGVVRLAEHLPLMRVTAGEAGRGGAA